MNLTENYIRELVKEELGIALEVTNTSNQIFQDILIDLREQKPEKTDICFIKTGSVNSSLHGVNFKVNYVCRNFSNKDLVENFDIDALTEGGSVFLDKRFVFVNVNLIAFNGTVDNKEALKVIADIYGQLGLHIMERNLSVGADSSINDIKVIQNFVIHTFNSLTEQHISVQMLIIKNAAKRFDFGNQLF